MNKAGLIKRARVCLLGELRWLNVAFWRATIGKCLLMQIKDDSLFFPFFPVHFAYLCHAPTVDIQLRSLSEHP